MTLREPFSPARSGIALALTGLALYVACFLVTRAWPGVFVDFVDAWLHLVDLESAQVGVKPISLGRFFYGMAGVGAVAFVAGAVFALCYNALGTLVTSSPGRSSADTREPTRRDAGAPEQETSVDRTRPARHA